jgi:decaprenylphospho-beta-D-erythro-pentofuranosid-2-ulose 2-reductase
MRDGLGRIQNVLVFGGTSEIGCATADALLADGSGALILAGRDPAGLHAAAQRLRRPRRRVHTLRYDAMGTASSVEDLLAEAENLVGDLDVAVVCVGILTDEAILADDTEATETSLHTNLLGPAVAIHATANRMARQGHGVVVVLSSIAGLRPRADIPTYAAAKAGLDSFARGLDIRLRGSGASIMVVRPGQVRTRMSAGLPDAPFTVDAATVARSIARRLGGGGRIVYVPGILRLVAAVLRALPAPVFHRLTTAARPAPEAAKPNSQASGQS